MNSQVFPRSRYLSFIQTLFPPGATVFWKGDPEPFFTPLDAFGGSPIVVILDVGKAASYGTSERRRCWVPEAQNGAGAYSYWLLQRQQWPVTIEVMTFNTEFRGMDIAMAARNRLRWMSGIKGVQQMGLTTARVEDVVEHLPTESTQSTFAATINISHGQVYWLQETDNDGSVIETVTSIPGTLTGGTPDPVDVELGPLTIPTS
jgi:hypothetical protein